MADSAKLRSRRSNDDNASLSSGSANTANNKNLRTTNRSNQSGRIQKELTKTNGAMSVSNDGLKKKDQDITRENEAIPMFYDDNLPPKWTRKLVQRTGGKTAGKYDVYIFSPEAQKFRSRTELAAFLTKSRSRYNIDDFDFTVHGRNSDSGKCTDGETTPGLKREHRKLVRRPEPIEEPVPRTRRKRSTSHTTNGPIKVIDEVSEEENLEAAKLVVKMDFGLRKFGLCNDVALDEAPRKRRRQIRCPAKFMNKSSPEVSPKRRGRPKKGFESPLKSPKRRKRGRPRKESTDSKHLQPSTSSETFEDLEEFSPDKKYDEIEVCPGRANRRSSARREYNKKLKDECEYEDGESAARVRPADSFMKNKKVIDDTVPAHSEEFIPFPFLISPKPKPESIPYTWTSIVPKKGSGIYQVLDSGHTYAKMAKVTRDTLAMTHSRSKEIVVDENGTITMEDVAKIDLMNQGQIRTVKADVHAEAQPSNNSGIQSLLKSPMIMKFATTRNPLQAPDKLPLVFLDTSSHEKPRLVVTSSAISSNHSSIIMTSSPPRSVLPSSLLTSAPAGGTVLLRSPNTSTLESIKQTVIG